MFAQLGWRIEFNWPGRHGLASLVFEGRFCQRMSRGCHTNFFFLFLAWLQLVWPIYLVRFGSFQFNRQQKLNICTEKFTRVGVSLWIGNFGRMKWMDGCRSVPLSACVCVCELYFPNLFISAMKILTYYRYLKCISIATHMNAINMFALTHIHICTCFDIAFYL